MTDAARSRPLDDDQKRIAADTDVLAAARRMAGSYARRLGLDRDTLESDAMGEIVRAARRYRPGLRTWRAYAIAGVRRGLIDSRRDACRGGMTDVPASLRGVTIPIGSLAGIDRVATDSAEDIVDTADLCEWLLSRLPARSRLVVERMVMRGELAEDVALDSGLSRAGVYYIQHEALAYLRGLSLLRVVA